MIAIIKPTVHLHATAKGREKNKITINTTNQKLVNWNRLLWLVFQFFTKTFKYVYLNHCCFTILSYASNNFDSHIFPCLTIPTIQYSTKCAYSTSNLLTWYKNNEENIRFFISRHMTANLHQSCQVSYLQIKEEEIIKHSGLKIIVPQGKSRVRSSNKTCRTVNFRRFTETKLKPMDQTLKYLP